MIQTQRTKTDGPAVHKRARWGLLGALLLAMAAGTCVWPAPLLADGTGYQVRYVLVVTLVVIWMIVVGKAFNDRVEGLLIDTRNRISLSRLQLFAWLVIVGSAFALEVAHNFRVGSPAPDSVKIPGELGLVMGMATTSFVASPAILGLKSRNGRLDVRRRSTGSDWSDLFRGEDQDTSHSADPARVQQFLVTLMLVAIYVAALWRDLGAPPSGVYDALPALGEGGLILLGVSHAAYLGGKATAQTCREAASIDTAPQLPDASNKPPP